MAISFTSVPDEIARSRTPLWFVANSDVEGSKIRFELYKESDDSLIYKTINLQVDNDGNCSQNFSKHITDQLGKNVPVLGGGLTGNADAAAVFGYYVKAVNIVDGVETLTATSDDRFAIFGEQSFFLLEYNYLPVDTAKTYLFLTAKPLERELYESQEEIATILFTAAIGAPVLNTVVYFTDGTNETVNTDLPAATKASIRHFDFSFREQVWNEFADPAKAVSRVEIKITGEDVIGDTLIYRVQPERSTEVRTYLFANRVGGFDAFAATGLLEEKETIEGEASVDYKHVTIIKQQPRVQVYSQHSGWLPKAEANAYAHMRDINRVWLVLINEQLGGITILPDSYEMPNDEQNINGFTIGYTFGDGRQDFDTLNAIVFDPTAMSLPIDMTDVTGLVSALLSKFDNSNFTDTALAENATAIDAASKYICLASGTLTGTSAITLTFSNVVNLREVAMVITNTGAKDYVIAGITISIPVGDDDIVLGTDDVGFVGDTISFPDDTDQKYVLAGFRVGSTFECSLRKG